jgi:hypothetical protein
VKLRTNFSLIKVNLLKDFISLAATVCQFSCGQGSKYTSSQYKDFST